MSGDKGKLLSSCGLAISYRFPPLVCICVVHLACCVVYRQGVILCKGVRPSSKASPARHGGLSRLSLALFCSVANNTALAITQRMGRHFYGVWWGVHRQCAPERVALQRCRSSNSRSPFIYISCNHNPVNLGNMQAMLNWAIQNGSHGSAPTPEGAAVNEDDPEFEEKRKHLMAVSVRYVTSLFLSKLSQFLSPFLQPRGACIPV